MEKTLKDIVNLGIGAAQKFKDNYGDVLKDFDKRFEKELNDLIAVGEKSNDETSQKIKQGADKALEFIRQFTDSTNEASSQQATDSKKPGASKAKKKAANTAE